MKALLLAVLAIGNINLAVNAAPNKPAQFVPAFDLSSPGRKLKAKAPEFIDYEILRDSPDKKYTARLTMTDAEIGLLTVFTKQTKTPVWSKKFAVSQEFYNVSGCVWVPGHGHWLAVSTSGIYGRGALGIWTEPRKVRWLKRAPSGSETPGSEFFDLIGVSIDGRTLMYDHEKLAPSITVKPKRYRLTIPKL